MATNDGTTHRRPFRGNGGVGREHVTEARGAATTGKTALSARQTHVARGRHGDHRGGHADGPFTDSLGFRHPGTREISKQVAALIREQLVDLEDFSSDLTRFTGMDMERIAEEERMALESHLRALNVRMQLRENTIIRRLRTRELIEFASTYDNDALARATHVKILRMLKEVPVNVPARVIRKRTIASNTGLG